jgi:hypothetical protein
MDLEEIRMEDINWINLSQVGDMADPCEPNIPVGS